MNAAIPLQPPAQRFAAIVEYLRRSVAARGRKGVMSIPLQLLLWSRLGRTLRRFAALAARIAAGTLPKPRPRAPRPRRARATPPARLPRGFAWLCRPVPEANIARTQLQYLLGQDDMASLLATPQAGRLLRPLCHMLGLRPPPLLGLPPRQSPPRQSPPRQSPPRPSQRRSLCLSVAGEHAPRSVPEGPATPWRPPRSR